ncbi:MAG TPA: MFS transporter [Acidobacteriota bacterium]|nr:MFS transporter [Acidobacteriota bacterium]HRR26394.1 MFS transporter [Acidobacteriota bacterium]
MRHYWKDPLTWSAHLGIFVFGIALATLGAILPTLFETIRLNPSEAGSLFLLLNFGCLLSTVLGGWAFDRSGYRTILVICAVGCSVSLGGLAQASTYPACVLFSFLLGVGGGGLNVGTNAMVAELYPKQEAAALNRLGMFFGFGAFSIPLVIGSLLERWGLTAILLAAAGMAAISAFVFLLQTFPAPKHAEGLPFSEVTALLRQPFLMVLAFLLFFESGNEMTTGGWLSTFAVDRLGATPAQGAFYLSVFWGALILGRAAAGALLRLTSPASVVQAASLLASLGLMLLVTLGNLKTGFLLSGLIGFCTAFIFPTVMGQASARYPAFSGTVIGGLMAVALVGGMLGPWVAGIVANHASVSAALLLPLVGFLAVFGLQTLARKL